jgi:hypothetical protein
MRSSHIKIEPLVVNGETVPVLQAFLTAERMMPSEALPTPPLRTTTT